MAVEEARVAGVGARAGHAAGGSRGNRHSNHFPKRIALHTYQQSTRVGETITVTIKQWLSNFSHYDKTICNGYQNLVFEINGAVGDLDIFIRNEILQNVVLLSIS